MLSHTPAPLIKTDLWIDYVRGEDRVASTGLFQRKVWVSAGNLPLLRIGDVWRDGKLEASPDYQLERFIDL